MQDDDVMDMAREQGIRDLSGVETAILESYGQINIIPAEKKEKPDTSDDAVVG